LSTIFGLLSLNKKINPTDFLKMKNAMIDLNYTIYEDSNCLIATTESIDQNGKNIFCGRIRNLPSLKKEANLLNGNIFDVYDYYQTIDVFDGHFIWINRSKNEITIYKDALGIESFYYYINEDILYFASEIKGLLCLKEKWVVNKDGILQVLGLLPALDLELTPYKGIKHLGPGEKLVMNSHIIVTPWWTPKKMINNNSREEIITDLQQLVEKSINEDMIDPCSCMLSGGLDSSIITALVSKKKNVTTYDVTYEDNDKYFKSYAYQTTLDKPYIDAMKKMCNITHHTIKLSQKDLSHFLNEVLILRDLPGMVDIDSSLFLFLLSIKDKENIILSGECADEFFGGYPWFYRLDLQESPYFPWTLHVEEKNDLLLDKFDIKNYLKEKKEASLNRVIGDKKQKLMDLTMRWFMQTLVSRGDVIGRACKMDIRMPFASKPLFEYLWNIDEKYFYEDGKEKILLRDAFKDILPEEIYNRKKNPYPKTHSPIYTEQVISLLKSALEEDDSILYQLFKKDKLLELVHTKGEAFTLPWYGQLMTGPQLIAFIYTIHQWGKLYPIILDI